MLALGVSANAGEHLLASILHQWPSYLAYVTSFLTIGVVWLGHSAFTSALRVRYATEQRRHVKKELDDVIADEASQRRPSYAFYALAIGIGFLLPTVGVALYLAIALCLSVPARTVHRLLRRH